MGKGGRDVFTLAMRSVRRAQTLRKRGHGGSDAVQKWKLQGRLCPPYGSRFPSESQPSAKLVERHHDVLAIGNGRALEIEP